MVATGMIRIFAFLCIVLCAFATDDRPQSDDPPRPAPWNYNISLFVVKNPNTAFATLNYDRLGKILDRVINYLNNRENTTKANINIYTYSADRVQGSNDTVYSGIHVYTLRNPRPPPAPQSWTTPQIINDVKDWMKTPAVRLSLNFARGIYPANAPHGGQMAWISESGSTYEPKELYDKLVNWGYKSIGWGDQEIEATWQKMERSESFMKTGRIEVESLTF